MENGKWKNKRSVQSSSDIFSQKLSKSLNPNSEKREKRKMKRRKREDKQ